MNNEVFRSLFRCGENLAACFQELSLVGQLLYAQLQSMSEDDDTTTLAQTYEYFKDLLVGAEDALEDFAAAQEAPVDEESTDPFAGLMLEIPEMRKYWQEWKTLAELTRRYLAGRASGGVDAQWHEALLKFAK